MSNIEEISEKIETNNISPEEPDINILEIPSFEELFNLFKSEKYRISKFSNNFQNFCKESEINNYVCEKNKEYIIPKEQKSLFEKFIFCKNRFDFQIMISNLLMKFFQFLKNIKPANKKEYSLIKNIFQIFADIKNSNLLMEDIQCLIEYGLLKDYNNNFYLYLFDINDKNVSQLLFFFDIKKYFLSNLNNINIFILKFNELIDNYNKEVEPAMFVRKIEKILSEILGILNIENNENAEIIHRIEQYRENIINSIHIEKIFEIFFSEEIFTSHLDILLNLFKVFPNEINNQINILISKNNKSIKKAISKFIVKHSKTLDDYIQKDTLYKLNEFSVESSFSFYLNQYIEGKNRLINIYNMFKTNQKIIKDLSNCLKNKLNKVKQAELIEQNIYNEEFEFELEEKEFLEKNKNKYFILPDNFKIYYISAENENCTKESLKILNHLINDKIPIDEYLGIDTEWKSSSTFLENYVENLSDTNKNKGIINTEKRGLSDIIQVAGNNYGFIFDTKSIYKNNKIRNKLNILFSKCNFIGFGFYNDVQKIGEFFKNLVYKNNFIELSDIYKSIEKKNAPELKVITLEFFDKQLDKRDQISNWSNRPLLKNQIKYGILDAYVLILIYRKLKEKISKI